MVLRPLLLAVALLAGCGGLGQVEFADGRCVIDGQSATEAQVDARQALVSRRLDARQPYFILVTIIVVAVGAASTVQSAYRVIAAERAVGGSKIGDRVRAALERHRQRPVRFYALVAGTLALLVAAGGAYVYLDLDKRDCTRQQQLLQYCQLALRSASEHDELAEQRRNLAAIQTTADAIRSLVDVLPADHQQQARKAVAELGQVVGRQSRLVGASAQRTEASARLVREGAPRSRRGAPPPAAVTKGAPAAGAAGAAAPAPPPLTADVTARLQALHGKLESLEGTLNGDAARLAGMEDALRRLAAGQGCACPPCPGVVRPAGDAGAGR